MPLLISGVLILSLLIDQWEISTILRIQIINILTITIPVRHDQYRLLDMILTLIQKNLLLLTVSQLQISQLWADFFLFCSTRSTTLKRGGIAKSQTIQLMN